MYVVAESATDFLQQLSYPTSREKDRTEVSTTSGDLPGTFFPHITIQSSTVIVLGKH